MLAWFHLRCIDDYLYCTAWLIVKQIDGTWVWDTAFVSMCLAFLLSSCELCPRYVSRCRLFNRKHTHVYVSLKLPSAWLLVVCGSFICGDDEASVDNSISTTSHSSSFLRRESQQCR